MTQKIKPTRSELIKLKKRIKIARAGHALLKRKRDGLIQEFFKVLEKAKTQKSKLKEKYLNAVQELEITRAIEGSLSVKSIAMILPKQKEIEVKTKAVMGVKVPEIKGEAQLTGITERGYGLISTSSHIDKSIDLFQETIKEIMIAAEIETTLKKLLKEIDKTKRRVNALEFKVIPEMEAQFKFVKMRLEEMEREDIFRLKKIKGKKMRK